MSHTAEHEIIQPHADTQKRQQTNKSAAAAAAAAARARDQRCAAGCGDACAMRTPWHGCAMQLESERFCGLHCVAAAAHCARAHPVRPSVRCSCCGLFARDLSSSLGAYVTSMDQYRAMYERSINDSDAFWKEVSEQQQRSRPARLLRLGDLLTQHGSWLRRSSRRTHGRDLKRSSTLLTDATAAAVAAAAARRWRWSTWTGFSPSPPCSTDRSSTAMWPGSSTDALTSVARGARMCTLQRGDAARGVGERAGKSGPASVSLSPPVPALQLPSQIIFFFSFVCVSSPLGCLQLRRPARTRRQRRQSCYFVRG